jgi:endonuclease YncB( thermonuclease family)
LIVIVLAVSAAYYMTSPRIPSQKGWNTLSDARFVQGRHSDGDSIEAMVNGQRYVFRLYFIDTIETSPTALERREAQGAYFGDPPLSEVEALRLAREASELTRETLSNGFTVHTRWERVNPDSDNPSIRAFVLTASGRDLAEILVSRGLALIKGEKAQVDHPDGRSARQIEEKLVALEKSAREQKLGGWALRTAYRPPLPAGVFLATETQALKQEAGKLLCVVAFPGSGRRRKGGWFLSTLMGQDATDLLVLFASRTNSGHPDFQTVFQISCRRKGWNCAVAWNYTVARPKSKLNGATSCNLLIKRCGLRLSSPRERDGPPPRR